MGFLDFIFDPGKEDRQRALDFQQSAINTQSAQEGADRKRIQGLQDERLQFANAWMSGKDIGLSGPSGNQKFDFSGQGVMPQAQQWLQDYYKYMKEAPDMVYNAQVGAQEGATNSAIRRASDMMGARGMGNSGMYAGLMSNILGQNIGRRSALEGERITRKGEMLGMGTQLSQSLLDKVLNLQNAAYGMPQVQGTQIPQMMSGMSGMFMNSANQQAANSPWGDLAGAWVTKQMVGKNQGNSLRDAVAQPADSGTGSNWQYGLQPSRLKEMAGNMFVPQSGGGFGQQLIGLGMKSLIGGLF